MYALGNARGRRSLREYFIRFLDSLLTREQRQLPPSELGRYRVLVGALALVIGMDGVFLLCLPLYAPEHRPGRLAAMLVGLAGYMGVLALLRRTRSPIVPSFILCGAFTLGLSVATLAIPESRVAIHAVGMLIPILSVYLLGPRIAFFFAAFYALDVGVLYQLVNTGFGQTRPIFSGFYTWAPNFVASMSLVFGWLLSQLHSSAREEANAALEKALSTLRESEGKLVSLFESTDDVVFAVDAGGHLMTANPAAHRLYRRLSGDELRPGMLLFPRDGQAPVSPLQALFTQALGGQRARTEVEFPGEGRGLTLETTASPVSSGEGAVVGVTFFGRDITERKEGEARVAELHRNLLDVSRQAGMAEVATGVLHNVGNILNSVNVSAELVTERLRGSRVVGLSRAAELLQENATSLDTFLQEERGRQLPGYLVAVSKQLLSEREALLEEMRSLTESVEHIKVVVSMQQAHARQAGLLEQVRVPQLLDDALKLHTLSFERHGIQVRREYGDVPPVMVDRHKLLQILLNLLGNARHALLESPRQPRQLTLRVACVEGQERLRIEVADNGVGVAPEHMERLFSQGFTTKKDGHGFGLHISALAAEEMSGSLTCASAGQGEGAAFTLELPLDGTDKQVERLAG
jgi:PAS domain S-box-containing protein